MPTIAIIDDNADVRTTLSRRIKLILRQGQISWKVIDSKPFTDLDDYPSWIIENNIYALILDERLHVGTPNVEYDGHDLVKAIRMKFKTLPVFAITSYSTDDDLQAEFKEFEEILSRKEFRRRDKDYVIRFIRAGQRYLDENRRELEKISEISEKIAKNKATNKDKKDLLSLQTKLQIQVYSEITNRSEWLDIFEVNLNEIDKLEKEMSKLAKKKNDSKKNKLKKAR